MGGFRDLALRYSPIARQFSLGLLCVLLALTTAACGGGAGLSESAQNGTADGFDSLPPPSALRESSYLPMFLVRDGREYIKTQYRLHHNVGVFGDACLFEPDWTPANPEFDRLAYACWVFSMEGYDRANEIRFYWGDQEPGADPADLWVGLSDFESDSWYWLPMPEFEPGQASLLALDLSPFYRKGLLESHEMYVVVLATGTVPWQLERIKVGDLTTVSGYVLADGGQTPLDYARVELEGPLNYSAYTGADGRWEVVGVLPGDYQLVAGKFGWAITPDLLQVTVAGPDQEVADFHASELPRYTVSGRVVDTVGQPVAWTTVEVIFYSLLFGASISVTDETGQWSIDLPDGNYKLFPYKQNWSMTPETQDITVAGEDLEVPDFIGEEY